MGFIGKEPLTGAYNMLDNLTASATASYSLTLDSTAFVPESANHLLVSLNGVIQKAGSSYTVSGSTLTFSSALTSSDSIDFVLALGNVLDIGTPSDATVTNAKTNFVSTSSAAGLQIKGDGTTDGTLQLNCSQNSHGIKLKSPAHSTSSSYTLTFPGTDPSADKFLKTDGSGNLSFADAGGGIYNLIAATDLPSEGASFTMDNVFSDTYDKYLIFGERFRNGNAQSRIDFFFRTGGSSGSDQGSNLGGAYQGRRHSSADMDGSVANGGAAVIVPNVYNDTEYHFMINVFYPTNTGVNTVFQGKSTFREGSTSYSGFVDFGYISLSTEDHTGFRITSSTGNFNSTACRLTVYGITDGA